MGAITLAMI
jgi:hypothetical protein